jgi:hypothetical protein
LAELRVDQGQHRERERHDDLDCEQAAPGFSDAGVLVLLAIVLWSPPKAVGSESLETYVACSSGNTPALVCYSNSTPVATLKSTADIE